MLLALVIVFSFNSCVKDNPDNFDSKIIVHRGLHDNYPENTLESFQAAVAHGFEYFEIDIVFTKDNVPIVFHDVSLDNITGFSSKVYDYNFEDLDTILIDDKYSIPSLDEFLSHFQFSFKQVFVDIKELCSYKSMLNLVDVIDNFNCKDKLILTCFYPEITDELGKLDEDLVFGSDNGEIEISVSQSIEKDYNYSLTWFHEVNNKYIEIAANENINIVVFTPNSVQELKQSLELGVYGIMTDEPILLREIMNQ